MFDFEDLDFYELLGVGRAASSEEIKRAYRREISKYHPDRFAGADAERQEYAQRRSQAITEAYGVLSDFSARSSYNLGQPHQQRRAARTTPTGSSQPRDHQAELYEQARAHLEAGRTLQAAGVLRQLQQINPFYRDSAALLARAEGALGARQQAAARPGGPRRILLAAGAAGGVALVLLAVWAVSLRSTPTSANPLPSAPPQATSAPAAAADTPLPPPTEQPTLTSAPATPAPTAEPPTAAPPTAEPTPSPLVNAASTTPPATAGQPLLEDDFSGAGWADMRGGGWSVGYAGGRYRIAVDAGVGTIWSYRSVAQADASVAADVTLPSGSGGLVLRFQDENNYLTFTVDAQAGAYRLERHSGGVLSVLAEGRSDAIRTGADAQNRLAATLRGDAVRLAVNGTALADVAEMGASASPRFGLVAISGDGPAEALFDNLQIRTVE